MSTEITINQDIVEINVTEEVVVIEAPSGAYPLPSMVSSVFGRTGNVVAQEGDYTLTQLGDVTIATPSNGQVLRYNGTTWVNATESFAGTVTSVDMSVPTGLTISGNPITTSGTLAVGLGAGYVIPTQAALDAKQDDLNGTGIVKSTAGTITYLSDNTANWNTAYNDSIVSASVTGTATKTLTLNQQDGGSVTASWTDTDTGLTSVGLSMPSAFSVANSPLTANGTLSVTGAGTTAQYVRGDGSLATFPSLTGFVPYTGATTNVNLGTHSLTAADLVINHVSGSGVAASITKGGNGEALTVVKSSGSGNAASITGGVTLLDELHLTTDLADAYIASAATWNAKQNAITLTTTGTSGAATLVGATLNIPQYQGVLTNPVTGTGTTNTLPKFTGASTIGNSNITDSGSLITLGSNTNISSGGLGIGTTLLTGYNLNVAKNITGGTVARGVSVNGTVQSDVTNIAIGYGSGISTAAASFTLTSLYQFYAGQGTIGAGSTITIQGGFYVDNTLTGGSTNYGFRGAIPVGTNRWNLYMDGTAANYLAGQLSIGTTSLTDFVNISNSTNGVTRVTTTNNNAGTSTQVQYQLSNGTHTASLGLTGTAFPSNLVFLQGGTYLTSGNSAGGLLLNTGAVQPIYFGVNNNEVARFGTNGGLGIGTTTTTGFSLVVGKNMTGSVSPQGIRNNGVIQSDATGTAVMYNSVASTAAATYTTAGLVHYYAQQGTIGAGNTLSAQYGFLAEGSLIGAGSNFGFYGNIPAAAGRWNFYAAGTANNYMAGSLGIGTTSLTNSNLAFNKTITGAVTSYGIFGTSIVGADVTTSARYYATSVSTAASAFTLADLVHFYCGQGSFGAGSTVTNQYGFFVQSSLQSATNNYGFYGNIPSGTNRWNLYMAGTAANYMAGKLLVGSTTDSGQQFQVNGTSLFQNTAALIGTFRSATANGQRLDVSSTATGIRLLSGFDTGITGTFEILASGGSSVLTLGTQGTERMRISGSGVGVNTGASNNASARLQVDSTTQGFLPPRMTTTEKLAIGTPAAGLMVYDTTLNQMSYYNGTLWINF